MLQAIERQGSFAAAARELDLVPSALTYRVRQLEDALDVLLFDRSSRQARPTAAGQELLREANTLGSKAASLELTNVSVEMKVAIEQLREQVQNIE